MNADTLGWIFIVVALLIIGVPIFIRLRLLWHRGTFYKNHSKRR